MGSKRVPSRIVFFRRLFNMVRNGVSPCEQVGTGLGLSGSFGRPQLQGKQLERSGRSEITVDWCVQVQNSR